jgi:hypothetical protein
LPYAYLPGDLKFTIPLEAPDILRRVSSSFTTEVFGRHWLTNKAEKKFPVRPTSIASPVEFTQRYVITGNFVECCCITTCEKERGGESKMIY